MNEQPKSSPIPPTFLCQKPVGLFPKVSPLNNCFYDSSNDPTEFNHNLFNFNIFFLYYDFFPVIPGCVFLCL